MGLLDMINAEQHDVGFDPQKILESLDPAQVGAALSKLIAASIGDMVVLFSRSPAHKHYSLADIEWMVMPPVSAGLFYIVEAVDAQRGFHAPAAVVTWAFVSEEVDQLFQQSAESLRRLRPDQWNNGKIGWLIDVVGNSEGVRTAMRWLAEGPFRDQSLKMVVSAMDGKTKVTTLQILLAEQLDGADSGSA